MAAILLGGWSARPLGGAPDPGFGDGVLELFTDRTAIPRLWQAHETWLRAQAAHFGIAPKWDGRFFGECLSAAGRERN